MSPAGVNELPVHANNGYTSIHSICCCSLNRDSQGVQLSIIHNRFCRITGTTQTHARQENVPLQLMLAKQSGCWTHRRAASLEAFLCSGFSARLFCNTSMVAFPIGRTLVLFTDLLFLRATTVSRSCMGMSVSACHPERC